MQSTLTIEHMLDCHPPVLSLEVTLLEVVQMMQAGEIPHWQRSPPAKVGNPQNYVVVLEQGKVQGLLTNQDIVRWVAEQRNFDQTLLMDVLNAAVTYPQISELATWEQAMHWFQVVKLPYLPVVDDQQLVGILSLEQLRIWELTSVQSNVVATQPIEEGSTDVVQRQLAEIQQQQSQQQRFYSALQSAMEGIAQLDPQGCFMEVNRTYAHDVGYSPEELVGLPWQTTVFANDIPILESAYNIMLDTGKISVEARGATKQGAVFYQQLTMVANRNDQGEFLGHFCFMQNISDRKLAEVKRIESEQRFQAIADCSSTLIWVADQRNQRTYFNAEWLKFTGRSLKREIEEGWATGIHPADVHDCLAAFALAFEEQRSVQLEYRYLNHAGHYRWLLDSGRPRFLPNGEFVGYVGSCIDITPFKQVADSLEQANYQLQENINKSIDALVGANAQLEESEARFRSLADSLPALIWVCDTEQLCTYVNQTWQTFTGRSLEQETNLGWLDTIHPDDRPRFIDQLQTCFSEEIPLHLEYRRCDRNGTYRWILNTGIPRYIADQFAGMIGCGLDITVSKQNQVALEQAISELTRSNRDLEEFAYVASHDLREPLRKIRSFSELLVEDYADQIDDTGRRYFDYVIDGAARMDALVQSVLQYSRVGRQQEIPEPVDLNTVVQQIANDFSLVIEQKQGWIIYDELPTIIISKIESVQLFQNLIGNALKFHGVQPPHITVKAQRQGTHWQISVSDTGIGIAPEFCDRVFTMFARQHQRDQYPGTGIGLSICRKIVENYGGQIHFETEVGKGTTFIFTLPAMD
ncbi:PAS domain S-box protein [Acaryochloris marina]|uniref:PAS domain S-box protein n=1 Tax=Acaryochloris marina TaxID=155978 RepID=UPI001EE67C3C|nr:PAS domain S-box protein [Acaryochloris marina]BDM77838.1 hypothetical protein AM10699_07080 [Acaryochloris marina MBIC10699]